MHLSNAIHSSILVMIETFISNEKSISTMGNAFF